MVYFDSLPEEIKQPFCDMIDKLIMTLDKDPELKEAFGFLEEEAMRRNFTIYQICAFVYEMTELIDRIDKNDWR